MECGAGDMYAREENSIYYIEEYVKNNFYKNYTVSAYFSCFIKNDSIDDNPTPTYKLLKKGNININEVAIQCGYEDPNYFTRCFKSHFGIPPSQIRKT